MPPLFSAAANERWTPWQHGNDFAAHSLQGQWDHRTCLRNVWGLAASSCSPTQAGWRALRRPIACWACAARRSSACRISASRAGLNSRQRQHEALGQLCARCPPRATSRHVWHPELVVLITPTRVVQPCKYGSLKKKRAPRPSALSAICYAPAVQLHEPACSN